VRTPSAVAQHMPPVLCVHSDAAGALLVEGLADGYIRVSERSSHGTWTPHRRGASGASRRAAHLGHVTAVRVLGDTGNVASCGTGAL
jgi:hypothetical protein